MKTFAFFMLGVFVTLTIVTITILRLPDHKPMIFTIDNAREPMVTACTGADIHPMVCFQTDVPISWIQIVIPKE
jgi:hypothetical protein